MAKTKANELAEVRSQGKRKANGREKLVLTENARTRKIPES